MEDSQDHKHGSEVVREWNAELKSDLGPKRPTQSTCALWRWGEVRLSFVFLSELEALGSEEGGEEREQDS